MSKYSFTLKTMILKSNDSNYIENNIKVLYIKKKLGEGSYGIVFQLDNDHVIKIFKNSTQTNTLLNETNMLMPIKNENRELLFFLKNKNDKLDKNYIIQLYAIGTIKDIIIDNFNKYDKDSYFIILPLCKLFYDVNKIYNKPLINEENVLLITIKIMRRMLDVSIYLEKKYNIINLDLKINNFMYIKNNLNYLNNLNNFIMIDFSLIKTKTKNIEININNNINKYYIWPDKIDNLKHIENIHAYSISINGLELLFGYNNVSILPDIIKINSFLKQIEKKK